MKLPIMSRFILILCKILFYCVPPCPAKFNAGVPLLSWLKLAYMLVKFENIYIYYIPGQLKHDRSSLWTLSSQVVSITSLKTETITFPADRYNRFGIPGSREIWAFSLFILLFRVSWLEMIDSNLIYRNESLEKTGDLLQKC